MLFMLLLISSTITYCQTVRTFHDTTITTSNTYSYNRISIQANTVITPGSGQSIVFRALPLGCLPLNTALSNMQNYVLTSVPRTAGYNPAVSTYTACDLMQTVQYMDGLGRP